MNHHQGVMQRLEAVIHNMDPRAPRVLAYHAAIERELDLALARALPRPKMLKHLSFGHKVSVWAATQSEVREGLESEVKALLHFNDLRNAIAHGDKKREVDAVLTKLLRDTPAELSDEDSIDFAAGWIFGIVNGDVD